MVFPSADPFSEQCWKNIKALCNLVRAFFNSEIVDGAKQAKPRFIKVLNLVKQVQDFNMEEAVDEFTQAIQMQQLKPSFMENPRFTSAQVICDQKTEFYEQTARAHLAKEVKEVEDIAYVWPEGESWHDLVKTSGCSATSYDLLLAAAQEPDSLLVSGGVKRSEAIDILEKAINTYELELQKLGASPHTPRPSRKLANSDWPAKRALWGTTCYDLCKKRRRRSKEEGHR